MENKPKVCFNQGVIDFKSWRVVIQKLKRVVSGCIVMICIISSWLANGLTEIDLLYANDLI